MAQQSTRVNVSVDMPCVNIDHSLITPVLPLEHSVVQKPCAAVRRQWGKFDIEAFTNDLSVSDLVIRPCGDDVSESLSRYDEVIKKLLNIQAPLKSGNSLARSPWYTESCRAIKIKTCRLERIYRSTHTVEDRDR